MLHSHAQHSHSAEADAQDPRLSPRRRLGITFLLIASFMVVELVGGIVSGSLALLADAGHMLTDTLALGLSYTAVWLASKETSPNRTYGFRRAELLAAFVNALLLMLLAIWIVMEALERLNQPRPILAGVLLWVALVGLAVNITAWAILHRDAKSHITVRSAMWHVIGDMLGSVGAVCAALVIQFTGWMAIDAMIGIGIAILIGISSARILYDSTNLLLDSVPGDVDSEEVRSFLSAYPNVTEICDLHIWGISSSETMLTAHLVVTEGIDRDPYLHTLLEEIKKRFGMAHMTIQLENTPMESCEPEW